MSSDEFGNLQLVNIAASDRIEASLHIQYIVVCNTTVLEIPAVETKDQGRQNKLEGYFWCEIYRLFDEVNIAVRETSGISSTRQHGYEIFGG